MRKTRDLVKKARDIKETCHTRMGTKTVKNLPTMQKTQVQSLGWEEPLDKGVAPVFFPGEFHRQRSLASTSPWGHKESNMAEYTHTHTEENLLGHSGMT